MKRVTYYKDFWKCCQCEHWEDETGLCHKPFKGMVKTEPDFACNQFKKLNDWSIEEHTLDRQQVRVALKNGLNYDAVRERLKHDWEVGTAITKPLRKRRGVTK
jgi:hypothetical protein